MGTNHGRVQAGACLGAMLQARRRHLLSLEAMGEVVEAPERAFAVGEHASARALAQSSKVGEESRRRNWML